MNTLETPKRNSVVILLAEDDEDDYMLTRDALKSAGITNDVRWVKNGEEMMQDLLRNADSMNSEATALPRMILLDLNMPRKDGREVLREIKSHTLLRRIPIVILTTSKAPEDVLNAYELGVNSFIRKPTSFNQFVNVFQIWKQYWFDVAEIPVFS